MSTLRRSWIIAPALTLLAFALPAVASEGRAGDGKHSKHDSLFLAEQYLERVSYLASNELEGRGTGQEGIDKAADYIAEFFEQCGVEPAGDDETYFQEFTLKLKSRMGEGMRLAIGTGGRKIRRPARLHDDYVPFPFSKSGAFKGDVVFAGYGIVNEDLEYNDYEGLDVTDKVVLLLRRAPKFDEFGIRDMAFRAKASRANAREAAAILIVNPIGDEAGDKLYDFEGGPGGAFGFGRASYGIPMLHITQETADDMLEAAGMADLATLQERIEDVEGPASAPLEGVSVRGLVAIEPIESPVRNVVGLIPGTGDHADEIIVLGAHYDHLGVRNKSESTFDPEKDISNGADDNASGTAMVMTMAKAYTEGPKPDRSIVLILFTAEEKGLLGSAHFAKHPTVDLDNCVAMVNFDMVGRLKNDRLEVGGMRTGGFEDMIDRLAEPYGLKIKDGGGGRGPSDHTNFYNKDIPVLFFFTGIHKQYHRPTDDADLINAEGAMRIAKLAVDCIDEIDAMADRPEFQEDKRGPFLGRQRDKDKEGDDAAPAPPRDRVRLGIRPEENDDPGVLVGVVAGDSPADRAGIREGDRIVKLGDAEVESVTDILGALGMLKKGDQTTVVVERKGEHVSLDVRFGKAKQAAARRGREQITERRGREQVAEAVAGVIIKCVQTWGSDAQCVFTVESGEHSVRLNTTGSELERMLEPDEQGRRFAIVLQFLEDTFPASDGAYSISAEVETVIEGIEVELEFAFEFEIPARPSAEAHGVAIAPGAERKAKRKAAAAKADPHADRGDMDEEAAPAMPRVRLGIMPAYGESEGEGFEISGVGEGGPADKAGMKETDRIYKIGKHKITNVYEYMEALQGYKPGDKITVIVIRDGKKVTLIVKAAAAKRQEAA